MDLRKCEFCGCETNAKIRVCCEHGRKADTIASRRSLPPVITKCGKCDACEIERIGCGCDGAYDDGCFLCHPEKHARPACPGAYVDPKPFSRFVIGGFYVGFDENKKTKHICFEAKHGALCKSDSLWFQIKSTVMDKTDFELIDCKDCLRVWERRGYQLVSLVPPVSRCALSPEEVKSVLQLDDDFSMLLASIPRCHHTPCPNLGTKWVSRHCAYCDTHGSTYLQDTPWAEFARKKGLAGRHGNVPDQVSKGPHTGEKGMPVF